MCKFIVLHSNTLNHTSLMYKESEDMLRNMTDCTLKLVLHAMKAYCCGSSNYNFTIQGKAKTKHICFVICESTPQLIIKIPIYQTHQRTEL
jgi:hypothetical protein